MNNRLVAWIYKRAEANYAEHIETCIICEYNGFGVCILADRYKRRRDFWRRRAGVRDELRKIEESAA